MTSKFKHPRPEPSSRLEGWLSLLALAIFAGGATAIVLAYLLTR